MKRSFLYLAGITVLAVALLWLSAGDNDWKEKAVNNDLFVPDISSQINDVSRVEIVSAGDQTVATMVKSAGRWQLEQLGGYQADWSRLQSLLAALAQAKVIEKKTDNPEYYARLGVEDIAAVEAGSVLVKLSIADDTVGILVGHEAQGRPGQYVRLQHSEASALVDQTLDVPTQRLDWAESTIVDIDASEVAEVEVIHDGGERLLVTKISADQTDFELVGMPAGREIKNSWAVNSMGSVFSMLNLESVRPAESVDWSGAVKMRLLTFSGMEVLADMTDSSGENLLRLQASYPAADIVKNENEVSEPPQAEQSIEHKAMDEVLKRVENINQRVDSWAFVINQQKFDVLVQKPEDLLKPLETE